MTTYHLIHIASNRSVAVVARAENWWAKGWGVLGRRSLPAGEGLWLPGVASVHTLGVRFPLDLLFLDSQMRTVRSVPNVPPGRWLARASGAAHTLELGAGTLASLAVLLTVGDGWRLERESS
jgi:uncharacterized membrane protein (UPF0127 family)